MAYVACRFAGDVPAGGDGETRVEETIVEQVSIPKRGATATGKWGLALPLYVGFAAAGVGVALPGAVLPALLARWHLNDAQGGRLFLFAWIASSLGALAVRGALRTVLMAGCGSVALGAAGLLSGTGSAAQADLWMGVFGIGLGMTMTSISLLRQSTSERSGVELIRLNFVWAMGACLCPTLAERTLRIGDLRPLLGGLGLVFVVLGVWVASRPQMGRSFTASGSTFTWAALRGVPAALVVMTILITGIEAAAGGWLATYSRRSGAGVAGVIAAPTCLWAGLLLSRLVWSVWDRNVSSRDIVRGSAALMAAASLLLVASGGGWTLLAAAFFLGCGLGPVYPLLLAAVLRYRRTGVIFFLAGVGSACLPWLTGVLAAARGSLRTGLLAPAAASLVIFTLAWTTPARLWATGGAESDGEGRVESGS